MVRDRIPVLVLVAVAALVGTLRGGFVDLAVYQYGGRAVLDGLPLYDADDPVTGYPFTYPPFAALVMVPLALVPHGLAAGLWTAASVAALAAVIVVVLRALGHPAPGWLVAALTTGALALEPVWQNLTFGQVNLVLMLAVLVDLLRPGRSWSGALIGVAAGIKLTPLVFVLFLALVGRPQDAARAVVSFAGTVAIGFLVMPTSATAYWTDGLVDARRVGPPALAHNQSAYGALTRLLDGPPSTLVWLAVAGTVTLAVLLLAALWWRRDPLLAACLAASATLLASPVAWSHHWVWAVPVALVLWDRSRWAGIAWTAVFVARPILWPPWGDGREYGWSPLDHLLGNSYLIAVLALCTWAALSHYVRRRSFLEAPTGTRYPSSLHPR